MKQYRFLLSLFIILIIGWTLGIYHSCGQQLKQIQRGTNNNQIPVTNGTQYTQVYRNAIPYILDTLGLRDTFLTDCCLDSIYINESRDTIFLRDGFVRIPYFNLFIDNKDISWDDDGSVNYNANKLIPGPVPGSSGRIIHTDGGGSYQWDTIRISNPAAKLLRLTIGPYRQNLDLGPIVQDSIYIVGDTIRLRDGLGEVIIPPSSVPDSIQRSGNTITLRDGSGSVDLSDLVNVPTIDSTIIAASTGISVTESPANTFTITNTSPDQTVTIGQSGIVLVTGTYPNFTVGATEVDGSTTNELQTISTSGAAGNITLSNGGGELNLNVNDADASATNELQTINGLNGLTQTFAISTAASGFNVSSSGSTHTWNLPYTENSTSLRLGLNAALMTNGVAIGGDAGDTDCFNCFAFGKDALNSATSGASNDVGIGLQALTALTSGVDNFGLGNYAGAAITTGNYNVCLGTQAGQSITTASNNIYIGRLAGRVATGGGNVMIGTATGWNANVSGSVYLGNEAGFFETTSNRLYIDNGSTTTPLIGGDFSSDRVGINTAIGSLARTLTVTGEMRVTDLTTDTPTRLVGADADGDFGTFTATTGQVIKYNGTNWVADTDNAGDQDWGIFASALANWGATGTFGSGLDVGIGTASPSRDLDVNGTTRLRGALYNNSNSAGSFGNGLISTSTGWTWASYTNGLTSDGSVIELDGQASNLHNFSGTGFMSRSAGGAFAGRTITGTSGVSVTNGDGVSANPNVSLTGLPLSINNLASNGIIVKTGATTAASREITSGDGITVTNGTGVSGNPVISRSQVIGSIHRLFSSPLTTYNLTANTWNKLDFATVQAQDNLTASATTDDFTATVAGNSLFTSVECTCQFTPNGAGTYNFAIFRNGNELTSSRQTFTGTTGNVITFYLKDLLSFGTGDVVDVRARCNNTVSNNTIAHCSLYLTRQ